MTSCCSRASWRPPTARSPRRPGSCRRSRPPDPHLLTTPSPLDESDERLFNSVMGRIAGVTAAETRERLLRAAADVFAERGYDGTRVADIAAAAGASNGALYAHVSSKGDLVGDALGTHGRRLSADLVAAAPHR